MLITQHLTASTDSPGYVMPWAYLLITNQVQEFALANSSTYFAGLPVYIPQHSSTCQQGVLKQQLQLQQCIPGQACIHFTKCSSGGSSIHSM